MFQKPIKTYLRKPAKLISYAPKIPVVHHFSDSESDENEGKDDTFDRLRKSAKPVAPVAWAPTNSIIFSNSTSDSDMSELEIIPIPETIPSISAKRGRKRKTSSSEKEDETNVESDKNKGVKRGRARRSETEAKAKPEKVRTEKKKLSGRSKKLEDKKSAPKSRSKIEKNSKISEKNSGEFQEIPDAAQIPEIDLIETSRFEKITKKLGRSPRASLADETKETPKPPIDPANDCWVSLCRLKLKQELAQKSVRNNEESNSDPESVRLVVSSSTEGDNSENLQGKPRKKMDSPQKKIEDNLIESLNKSAASVDSPSLFSTSQSVSDSPDNTKENLPENSQADPPSKGPQILDKISRDRAQEHCSVVLQRYDSKLKSNVTVNQTFWSSTPLFSRIRDKTTRIQLSPIPIPSSVGNRRNLQGNESEKTDETTDKVQKRKSAPEENLIEGERRKKQSISIIDEDTEEFDVSHQLERVPDAVVNSSVKQRIEKRLFSSPKDDSLTGRRSRRVSGRSRVSVPSSREGSVVIMDSTIELSSGVQGTSGQEQKVELGTMESTGDVSPLMFESDDEPGKATHSGAMVDDQMETKLLEDPSNFAGESKYQNLSTGGRESTLESTYNSPSTKYRQSKAQSDSTEIEENGETKLVEHAPGRSRRSHMRYSKTELSQDIEEEVEIKESVKVSHNLSSKTDIEESKMTDISFEVDDKMETGESVNVSQNLSSKTDIEESQLVDMSSEIDDNMETGQSANASQTDIEESKMADVSSEIEEKMTASKSVNVSHNLSSQTDIEDSKLVDISSEIDDKMETEQNVVKSDDSDGEEAVDVAEGSKSVSNRPSRSVGRFKGGAEISEIPEMRRSKELRKSRGSGDMDLAGIQLPNVVLTRLPVPLGVTDRRKRYKKENRLSAISEMGRSSATKRESVTGEKADDSGDVVEDLAGPGAGKSVFLKPGKSWARSLSILNRIQDKYDLDALAPGKGKNWRQSVISVLNMQSQGLPQSCISKDDPDPQSRTSGVYRASAASRKWSSARQTTSPGRFIRRVSFRVVPDRKSKIIEEVHDSSFLEAYGITASRDRRTLVQRSASPVRKSSYKLRNSAIDTIIPQPLRTARNVVLDRCDQVDSCPFSLFYSEEYLNNCRKIGEGVYGEVFLFDDNRERSVIKIIPIEGVELVNGEPQKKFDEILSEIIIAKELHDLRVSETHRTDGFVEVKNIRCLVGRYPERLVELWGAYDEEKKSDNDCPSMFGKEQLYIALELGDGGKDLEGFVFQNASEAYSSFIQTALTLAVAEKALDFEHRDLHWGNILISRTNDKEMTYKLDSHEIKFPCQGVKVSIIDFTLSRMSYEGCCIFNDLALDPSLFTAVGEYQFDIYRLMKDKVNNNWQVFAPHTNILWLHYTLDKMITAVRYRRKGTKIHNNYIQRLRELEKIVLDYESAFDFVNNCDRIKDVLQINQA